MQSGATPTLTLGELFAGYGGLGLAVEEIFNAKHQWYAEIDKAPSAIMSHHFPGIPNYGDVTTIDWSTVPKVDIISGGSPCQDLSLSGKRNGMAPGTRSNLWVTMREAIAHIKPTFVIWENVRGSLSAKATSDSDLEHDNGFLGAKPGSLRALGRVLGDLAELGYDTQWHSLRASDVGAPHNRFRVFVLATRRDAANPFGFRRSEPCQVRYSSKITSTSNNQPSLANTHGQRHHRCRSGAWTQGQFQPSHRSGQAQHNLDVDWGKYTPAIRRWETITGRAPAPTAPNKNGNPRLTPEFSEWMMGLPPGWVTSVPGISRRQMIKACGNGVLPRQAAAALRIMLERELAMSHINPQLLGACS